MFERISRVTVWAGAGVVARHVQTKRVLATGVRLGALVHVLATNLTVTGVSWQAFAQKVGRQIAALGVLHASGGERRVLAFVYVCDDFEEKKS